ncbi:MAG TPA: NADH-quinone oxidoreductase subunit B, partial [Bacteroidetes bacterium]|nr:NADH-quinone oxidoreductase subunit B [Bacteroidota bacterium]
MSKSELEKRTVVSPEGESFEVDPMKDYFCDAHPKVHEPVLPIFEKFLNWARSES